MPSKKGGGFMEGLWAGTAFFAAKNSTTFAGFVGKFMVYALVLVVVFMILGLVLQTITGKKEKFSVSDIKCPQGSTPTEKCPGTNTPGCLHPSGNCEATLG
jgi:preprotein translocase subunit SecG